MGRHSARGGSNRPSSDSKPNGRMPAPASRPVRRVSSAGRKSGRVTESPRPVSPGVEPRNFDQNVYNGRGTRRGTLESAPEKMLSGLERHKKRRRRLLAISSLSVVGVLLLAAIGGFAYLKYIEANMNTSLDGTKKLALKLEKQPPGDPYNMLIMGFDKRKGETAYRSDTMILARIDPKQQKVWMISIPRDYRAEIPGHGTNKINAAFSLGQEELAIESVEKLTGQKVNHFMGVTFKGFAAVVDAMGGVEVDVPAKINDPKADHTPDKSASVIDAGLQLLDGDHALTLVRTRAYANADFTRMENQQMFFKAVADQAAKDISMIQLPGLVAAIVPNLATDMSVIDLTRTARDLKNAGSANIYTTTLPGAWDSPFIVPDEEAKAEILTKFAAGLPFEDAESEEIEAVTLLPENITVTVRNGTTRAGLANQAASVLRARGFTVGEVGNTANQSVYDQTMLVYKESVPSAEMVGKFMQPGIRLVESRGMYAYESEILLVIGKDWDITKLPVANVTTN